MPTLARTSQSADRSIERLSRAAIIAGARAYRDAVASDANGGVGAASWAAWETTLRRAAALSILIGIANARRTMPEKDRPSEPVSVHPEELSKFASIEIRGGFDGPFIEAVEVFRREIPDLGSILPRVMGAATEAAARVASEERARAWPSLRERIVKALSIRAEREARQAAERGVVFTPSPITREALADAIGSTLGQAAIVDRLGTQYRTALMGGFNAGTKDQLDRARSTFPVYRLSEIQDRRTRGNPTGLYPDAGPHFQMDGFCAPSDDPVWERIWPPNGWNCRASVEGIAWPEAEDRGWVGTDGTLDRLKLRREFESQWSILQRGDYPDPGFAVRAGAVADLR